MTSTDSTFKIGSRHEVCEDYAHSGDNLIIVADGCSGSPNTDIGSRIVAMSVKEALKVIPERSFFEGDLSKNPRLNERLINSILLMLSTISNSMLGDSNSPSLQSTLLFAYKTDKGLLIFVAGDGLITFIGQDDSKHNIRFTNENGYPFYLSYLLDSASYKQYSKIDSISEESDLPGFRPTVYKNSFYYFIPNIQLSEFKCVILATDGVESFSKSKNTGTSLTRSPMDYKEVLDTFLPFKGYTGKFVQRRMHGFLKHCKREGIDHHDDFSIAAMRIINEG